MKRLIPLMVVAALGCVEKRELPQSLSSFEVEVTATLGAADAPLPFPDAPFPTDVTIRALSSRGGPFVAFPGEGDACDADADCLTAYTCVTGACRPVVTVRSAPGKVLTTDGKGRVLVPLIDGVGSTSLTLSNVYGRTHVCAFDDRRPGASYAIGCGQTMYFEMPRVDQVQITNNAAESPLIGSFLEIRSGDLIVTGIFAEGFYLTDLDAAPPSTHPGNFGSLFIFSFSYPEGIVIGDRLSSVIGTVQEFTGSTQLVFPSWTRREQPTDRCSVPALSAPTGCETVAAPTEITDAICSAPTSGPTEGLCGHSTDNIEIESLEADVVVARNVRTPTRFMDCDLNLDGDVPNFEATCSNTLTWDECEAALQSGLPLPADRVCCEIACKQVCNLDVECSELSSLRTYGQWSGALNSGAGPKMSFLTREGLPELNVLDPQQQGIVLDIAGNLRHSLPARPRWVVVSRFAGDIVFK